MELKVPEEAHPFQQTTLMCLEEGRGWILLAKNLVNILGKTARENGTKNAEDSSKEGRKEKLTKIMGKDHRKEDGAESIFARL